MFIKIADCDNNTDQLIKYIHFLLDETHNFPKNRRYLGILHLMF